MWAGIDVFDDRVLFRGVEISGAEDGAPNVGGVVAAFGDEALGERARSGEDLRDVGFFEAADKFTIFAAPQLGDGGGVHARPGVDQKLTVGGPLFGVSSVLFGENGEVGAIEIGAAYLNIVGVLVWHDAADVKPYLPFIAIDPLDTANHPVSFGDLILHLAGEGIVEIEMIPAVALRHPDNFVGVVEIFDELFAGVIDKGFAVFVDDRRCIAGFGVDGDEAEDLVSALVVEECETGGISGPTKLRNVPGGGEEGV